MNLNPSCALDQWLDDECCELARVLSHDSFEFSEAYRIQGWRGQYRVVLRPRTGDVFIFHEIWSFNTYALPKVLLSEPGIRTVVDLGANIGLASLFFYDQLAPERLIAVEPLASNFAMLQSNLAFAGGSVVCVHAAVGRTTGFATIVDASAPTWGAAFTSSGDQGNVRQTTIPELMLRHRLDRIGLLKIDVEGAEEEIFADDSAWLEKVDVVIIELHTELAAARFRTAMARHDFRQITDPGARFVVALNPAMAKAVSLAEA